MNKTFAVSLAVCIALQWVDLAPAQNTGVITATRGTFPNLVGKTQQAMRYRPDEGDFVIENGAEYFNRPLYGRNTAFRVDGGDKPEFTLYLPGRGGNLRFGVRSPAGTKWLADAAHIITRYRPGAMLYEIHDPLLGSQGVLKLTVLALNATDGLVAQIEPQAIAPNLELVWAYGGVNGQRGARDGDIGTERVPISEYFQLKPEFCQGSTFTLGTRTFTLRSQPATIIGIMPEGAKLAVADSAGWGSFDALLASVNANAPARPVVIGQVAMSANAPLMIALQRVADGAVAVEELGTYREVTAGPSTVPTEVSFLKPYQPAEIPRVFAEADAYYRALRQRVSIETPDPYINAAVGALNLAADAVWDDPQSVVMHGAIAWRSRLLGWRGPYVMDELGWHERARKHFSYWATRQNTNPIPDKLPPADENANLSRNEAALHSNGDLSNSHYDMNLVYIDALFRHLLWTGDIEFARQVWPVIERHLAWERRLFRREFGPEKLPLYEAYAAIWASDDLQYSGGGVSHTSAFNYYHNTMAARVAKLIGKDAAPYEKEAELIAKAMRTYLWLPELGEFAENKDLLGNQLVHPSAGLWSFYHTIDSGVPTPQEAWQMAAAVDRMNPHLPVHGPGVPADVDYHVLASTDWMPYSWSINNVVMGENIHTALGFWQAGRFEDAFRLTKSALMASMFMGICPGNIGSMNYLDVYRRESQRDFGDGSGVLSRAIVEGLFGVKPDALAGELQVTPGFPAQWNHARLTHPDLRVEFTRDQNTDRWVIGQEANRFRTIHLRLPAVRERVASVNVNGTDVTTWKVDAAVAGHPMLEVTFPTGRASTVIIRWEGALRPVPEPMKGPAANPVVAETFDWRTPQSSAKYEVVNLESAFNDRVTEIFKPGKYRSPRSPGASLALPAQGIGAWAGHSTATAEIDDTGLRRVASEKNGQLVMPNGLPFATPGPGDSRNIIFTSQWDNYPHEVTVPLSGRAAHVCLLMAGSTYFMQSRIDNGEIVVTYTDGTSARLALQNPTTWWPIEQDYFIDDYQFRRPGPIPPRIDLKTGEIRLLDEQEFKGRGGTVRGGAATALELSLDPARQLRSLTVRTIANDVVIGLMGATLVR